MNRETFDSSAGEAEILQEVVLITELFFKVLVVADNNVFDGLRLFLALTLSVKSYRERLVGLKFGIAIVAEYNIEKEYLMFEMKLASNVNTKSRKYSALLNAMALSFCKQLCLQKNLNLSPLNL